MPPGFYQKPVSYGLDAHISHELERTLTLREIVDLVLNFKIKEYQMPPLHQMVWGGNFGDREKQFREFYKMVEINCVVFTYKLAYALTHLEEIRIENDSQTNTNIESAPQAQSHYSKKERLLLETTENNDTSDESTIKEHQQKEPKKNRFGL